jgi:hypothetical protein
MLRLFEKSRILRSLFAPPNRVVGVRLEDIPEQAAVVVRITEMQAAGLSFSQIVKTLNAEVVPAPRRKNKCGITDSRIPSSTKEITRNELYDGVRVWNHAEKLLHPKKGLKVKRVRPESE